MVLHTKVEFYNPDYMPPAVLVYSVIAAWYRGGWIFVRHNDRSTWEIAGGHIEAGESPLEAAGRELREETGTVDFSLHCVATYSVTKGGETGFGRLYYAEIGELGEIPDVSEIAERRILDDIPGDLTYPDIQPALFRRCLEYARFRKTSREPRNSNRE